MSRTLILRVALALAAAGGWLAFAGAANAQAADPNSFNRLMRPAAKRNLPPAEDGIHDPAAPGTPELQTPREAFAPLPKASSGNRVDWTAALQSNKIAPHWDAKKPNAKSDPLDLDIVLEVKGSTPDVVFSHARHTRWLDCANCHPAVFETKKGANPISMATLMLGQNCGVCHGRVAFGASECRLCHSKAKAQSTKTSAAR